MDDKVAGTVEPKIRLKAHSRDVWIDQNGTAWQFFNIDAHATVQCAFCNRKITQGYVTNNPAPMQVCDEKGYGCAKVVG